MVLFLILVLIVLNLLHGGCHARHLTEVLETPLALGSFTEGPQVRQFFARNTAATIGYPDDDVLLGFADGDLNRRRRGRGRDGAVFQLLLVPLYDGLDRVPKQLADDVLEVAEDVDAVSGATSSSDAFKSAVDRAFKKAEIAESYKTAYANGIFAGANADKSVYVMVTVEKNVPFKMEVFYLDANGKIKAADKLSADELAVKQEIETPTTGVMHKYAYRPAAFGETDAVKTLSGKVIDAIKVALEAAGR